MDQAKPIPVPDEASEGFWAAAAAGRLELPKCDDCARFHYPPQLACPHCGSGALSQAAVSGDGNIYSHTVLRIPPGPGFADLLPLPLVTVELVEQPGLLITTNLVGASITGPEDPRIRIGAPVRVSFEPLASGDLTDDGVALALPQFELA